MSDFAGGAVTWRRQKGLTVGLGSGLARPYFRTTMRARRKKARYILVDRFGGFYDRQLRLLSGVFRRFDASFLGGLNCVLCRVFPCEKNSLGFSSCPGGFESE